MLIFHTDVSWTSRGDAVDPNTWNKRLDFCIGNSTFKGHDMDYTKNNIKVVLDSDLILFRSQVTMQMRI